MCDPTDHVQTYEGAIVLASAMLYAPPALTTPSPAPEIWKSNSEPVLAALLFAASPCQRGGGMAWVNSAVSTLAEGTGDSAGAIGIKDLDGYRFIRSLDTLHDRQRDSVLTTVRDAIMPWLAA